MAGVDPENAGIASFHAMFSFCDQRNGRFVSWLTPLPDGPRHAGQFSTAVVARGARSMSNVECQTSNCGGMTNVKMTKVAQNVFDMAIPIAERRRGACGARNGSQPRTRLTRPEGPRRRGAPRRP